MTRKSRRPRRLALEPVQTLRTIGETCATLREALSQHDDVVVDCSAVSEADLTLVQLLLSARKTAERSGKRLAVAGAASGPLGDALVRGGVLDAPAANGAASSFWVQPIEAT